MLSSKTISDIMVKFPEVKAVFKDDCFHDAIEVLNKNKWGAVFIVDKENHLQGIITDGDARRVFAKNQEPIAQLNSDPVSKYMNPSPTTINPTASILESAKLMNRNGFLCLPVVNEKKQLMGVVHLQHLVKELLAGNN